MPRGRRKTSKASAKQGDGAVAQARYVIGINPLQELLQFAPGRVRRVFVASNAQRSGDRRKRELIAKLQQSGVPVEFVPVEHLGGLVGDENHQSFVAEVESARSDLKALLRRLEGEEEPTLVVLLDGITDPQNFGAVLRAAECLGASAVVYSNNRCSGLSPAAVKASAGASELIELVEVANLAEAARRLKKAGLWIVAADVGAGAVSAAEFDWPARCALVLGAEGHGVSHILSELSDFAVKIPLRGRIQSLNVSQAAALLFFLWSPPTIRKL